MSGLKKRDGVRVKRERPRGLLNIRASEAELALTRYWPSPDLAPFVEHYWSVRWDFAEPRTTETVPHPSVHMVLEADEAEIVGLMKTRFFRWLTGRGRVLGTKFRPGAFRPFVDSPVSSFTGRRLPVTDVFGPNARSLLKRALHHNDDRQAIAVVERFLRSLGPKAGDSMILVGRIVVRIADDRAITRVAQLSTAFGINPRALERLFREHVGASPKWVIQRYRLLEAADRMASGRVAAWADLALDLGYADQAHFIRDFKTLIGRSPAGYARTLATPQTLTRRPVS